MNTNYDNQFERNYSECSRIGIPCGAFWYSYATSAAEARQEASVCLQVLQEKQFAYPIYFDLEEKKQFALGKQVCSEIGILFGVRIIAANAVILAIMASGKRGAERSVESMVM